jgi:hypothetical protein
MPSPINFFRQLLLMSPVERNKSLASRMPESRALIMHKVHEYLALDPGERELRLRATELRWYLTPLLQKPPGDREAQLAQVPPELRQLVKSRLAQWDMLPPTLKQEFLGNDKTLNYVAHIETSNAPAANPRQQMIADKFNEFLSLTPSEKKKMLGTLSVAEQAQMEKTLQVFEQLPSQQRELCERNYAKFTGLSSDERAEFLKNAENWSKMSPAERQTWRDLVAQVSMWPPAIMPPMSSSAPQVSTASADGN